MPFTTSLGQCHHRTASCTSICGQGHRLYLRESWYAVLMRSPRIFYSAFGHLIDCLDSCRTRP